jgi:hypothetical protein
MIGLTSVRAASMNTTLRAVLGFGIGFVLCVSVAGCGKVTVKGRILKGGKPIEISQKGMAHVSFYPSNRKESDPPSYSSSLNREDGTFEIKDIPKGEYHVGVGINDPYPGADQLRGRYDGKESNIVRQVNGKDEIVIDLEKETPKEANLKMKLPPKK